MREPDPSIPMKTLGVGVATVALLAATIWSVEHSKTDVTAMPSASPKAAPARTLDPAKERRRVEHSRAGELSDANALAIKLNKSLGILFVRGVRIDRATLLLTIDGSVWDNETEAERADLTAQMAALWADVHRKYNRTEETLRVRLLDMDGSELTPLPR